MSEYKSYKKADLAQVAKKIGIQVRSKDTKTSLLDKIELFLEQNPEEAKALMDLADDEIDAVTLVANDATEDEDDDDEDVVEVEADDDESAADDDADDKDYNAPPPINLKEWVVDPAIGVFESAHDAVLRFTDAVGVTAAEANDDLRESLSRTVSLNYLELAAEFAYFLYLHVPLVAIKDNASVHQVLKDNIPALRRSTVPVPDVTALFDISVALIAANWVLYAVALPLVVAYYVNFSRRVVVIEDDDKDDDDESFVVRLYKYDPFVFAVAKVLIYYFVATHGALTAVESFHGFANLVKNYFLIHLGLYHLFVSTLGNFPLVVGVANVAVGLYSQFEDY